MMKNLTPMLGLVLLLLSGKVAADNCNGNLLAFADLFQMIEEYDDKVRVYVPLEVKVSQSLVNCADEIWIEPIDSNKIKFYGPTLNKNGKLLDEQFKRIKLKNGRYSLGLTETNTKTWVRLQHYSFFPAGLYSTNLRVTIVRQGEVVEEQVVWMSYYSLPKIAIELDNNSQGKVGGSDGDYQIELGELRSGQTFYWGIKVLSNSAYEIVLDSEFNGLRHQTNPNASIDYSITFDNVKISSQQQLVRRYDFSTGVKNTWFGFEFELGNIEMKPAGRYQDNLSLTIYPY